MIDGRPLRIGIAAQIPAGRFGGVEQFTMGLAAALGRLPDGQEEYLFLVDAARRRWLDGHLGAQERTITAQAGIGRLRRLAGERLPGLRSLLHGARDMGRTGPLAMPRSTGALEAAGAAMVHFPFQTAFATSLPSIYQPWDLQHRHLPGFFSEDSINWREFSYAEACRRASVVVVASRWTGFDIADAYRVEPAKIAVIPIPPVLEFYPAPNPADLETVRARFDLPERFLFYPAQTWPHKNHERLLRAVLTASAEIGEPLHLVCSGAENDHTATVRRAAEGLGIAARIHFCGFASPLEIRSLYRLSRAVVFPSLFEGWGFPILEAFASGVPVAASAVTSIPEMAGDGALLFDPTRTDEIAAAIAQIWTDEPLRDRLVSAGRQVVEGLAWEGTARTFRSLYRMIGQRPLSDEDVRLVNRHRLSG